MDTSYELTLPEEALLKLTSMDDWHAYDALYMVEGTYPIEVDHRGNYWAVIPALVVEQRYRDASGELALNHPGTQRTHRLPVNVANPTVMVGDVTAQVVAKPVTDAPPPEVFEPYEPAFDPVFDYA